MKTPSRDKNGSTKCGLGVFSFLKEPPTMVRTKGPLLSLAATGTIGNVLTASSSKGRSYLKLKVTPKDPRSPRQLSIRAMVTFLNLNWSELDQEDKDLWNPIAAANKISVQNAYLAKNMERWTTNSAPSDDPAQQPPDSAKRPYFYPPLLLGRGARLRAICSPILNSCAMVFYRDVNGLAPPTWENAVHVVKITAPASIYWTDTPLAPGSYYYHAISFTHHGVFSVQSDQRLIVIP